MNKSTNWFIRQVDEIIKKKVKINFKQSYSNGGKKIKIRKKNDITDSNITKWKKVEFKKNEYQ